MQIKACFILVIEFKANLVFFVNAFAWSFFPYTMLVLQEMHFIASTDEYVRWLVCRHVPSSLFDATDGSLFNVLSRSAALKTEIRTVTFYHASWSLSLHTHFDWCHIYMGCVDAVYLHGFSLVHEDKNTSTIFCNQLHTHFFLPYRYRRIAHL